LYESKKQSKARALARLLSLLRLKVSEMRMPDPDRSYRNEVKRNGANLNGR